MNTILFICYVICICLGLFLLNSQNPIFEKWESILLMAVLLIVFGCAKAGVILFDLFG